MRAVEYRNWPSLTQSMDTGLVARIEGDFDSIAEKLSAKPKIFTQRATKTFPQVKYRSIFFILLNGAPGVLTEYFHKAGQIGVNLRVEDDQFAFDDDYIELITALGIDPDQVEKFEGNFTWLPNRKSKRLKRKDVALSDDWWGHLQFHSPTKPRRKI